MKEKILGMRLTIDLIDKINNIAKKTGNTKKYIVKTWINGTTIDEQVKEFTTSCISKPKTKSLT